VETTEEEEEEEEEEGGGRLTCGGFDGGRGQRGASGGD